MQSLFSSGTVWIGAVLVGSGIAFEEIQHREKEQVENGNEQSDQKPAIQPDIVKAANGQADGCDEDGDIENPGKGTDEQNQDSPDYDVVDQEIPHFKPGRTAVKVAERAE